MANIDFKRFLDDVESRIDAAQEQRLEREWLDFSELKCTDPFFSPRRTPGPSSLEWPKAVINQAFDDMDWMLYLQLKGVSDTLAGEVGLLLSVRANYGTGIIPTMFGAQLFRLKDELDTLPGTRPLEDGVEALWKIGIIIVLAIKLHQRIDFTLQCRCGQNCQTHSILIYTGECSGMSQIHFIYTGIRYLSKGCRCP